MKVKYYNKTENYPAYIKAEVRLISEKDSTLCEFPRVYVMYWDDSNEVRLTVGDNDDLDLGVYYVGKDQNDARRIFHELMNFLKDIEGHRVNEDTFFDYRQMTTHISIFFPDIGCPRKREL